MTQEISEISEISRMTSIALANPLDLKKWVNQLLLDLQSKPTLCILKEYPGISLESLNQYLQTQPPIENPFFGLSNCYDLQHEKLIPLPMPIVGKDVVLAKINSLMHAWLDSSSGVMGKITCYDGAFNITEATRMPDIAYTPPHITSTIKDQKSPKKNPFSPSFIIELGALTTPNLKSADYKMRNRYFKHGVLLAWLIDIENKIMIVYKTYSSGKVYSVGNRAWRDLSGERVLPGFTLKISDLENALNPGVASSDDDEDEN